MFTVEPIEGEASGDHQYGWLVLKDGHPFLEATTGGTGPCWNVSDPDDEDDTTPFHVCDLAELIEALEALRDSEAHRRNVARWE